VAIFATSVQGTTVTSSVTQVYSTAGLTSPRDVTLMNQGTATIYVGGSQVTATNTGVPVASGQQLTVAGAAQNLWAITSAGTATVEAGLASVDVVV